MIEYILYALSICIAVFVLNRYFSGTPFSGLRPNLEGYTAVITGGNAGIGRQTVIALVEQGCKVIIGARDTKKSQDLANLLNTRNQKQLCQHHYLDLGDIQSIKQFAKRVTDSKIDFLINNAGVMAIPKKTLTKSGFQMQYGVNHLGHFYLTHLLWQKLNKSKFFRVINISSMAHKKYLGFFWQPKPDFSDMNFQKQKYDPVLAYSRSKLYNNLFTHALADKIQKEKIQGLTVSLHPGVVRSELTRYMITGWKEKCFQLLNPLYSIFTKSTKEGAQTTIATLMLPPQKLINGAYYSDCSLSSQSKVVNKQNWQKLWQISQRDLQVKFGKQ